MKDIVGRIRAKRPELRVFGATVLSALGARNTGYGFPEQDQKRRALNDFIRTSGLFDGVIDFDQVRFDAQSGGLKPEFVPESTTGGPGDKLHPTARDILPWGWQSTSIYSSKIRNCRRSLGVKSAENVAEISAT